VTGRREKDYDAQRIGREITALDKSRSADLPGFERRTATFHWQGAEREAPGASNA
jgi:hypothetical protein